MSIARQRLRDLLDSADWQDGLLALWKAATTPERKSVGWATCKNCHHRAEVEVDAMNAKDAVSIMSFVASYGLGKPPEEKKIEINVNQRIEQMSDAELEIVAGQYRELEPGA